VISPCVVKPEDEKLVDGKLVRRIPGFYYYWITDTGEVWSERSKPMWMKLSSSKGYRRLSLVSSENIKESREVKTLVALAFIGEKPQPGLLVCHKDGNNRNDHFSNLYYGTYQDNANDRVAHGTQLRGEKASKVHWNKPYSDEQVRNFYIEAMTYDGPLSDLASKLGVKVSLLYGYCGKYVYSWLTDKIDAEFGWNTESFRAEYKARRKKHERSMGGRPKTEVIQ
jgi:hypothetical protein